MEEKDNTLVAIVILKYSILIIHHVNIKKLSLHFNYLKVL